jgi:DNA repair exonuclease SbcCD nuclease subunit
MSDLHLEFSPDFRPENTGADVLILSGDICVAEYFNYSSFTPQRDRAKKFYEFFKYCSEEFKNVIYIVGNHEHYYGNINTTVQNLRLFLNDFENIHLLDNEAKVIDDVCFVGGTLWTDVGNNNPIAEFKLAQSLNDFRLIKNVDDRNFSPYDSTVLHAQFKQFISKTADEHEKVVVVGHHAPSFNSVAERFKDDYYLNFGFYSNLESFIIDHPTITLWTHGHMHNCSDYHIGTTRVVCNPRGYNDENRDFNPDLILEI